MTVSVVVPATMSSDGLVHTYTDDSDPNTGLDGGGHVARLVPLILDNISITNAALSQVSSLTTVAANANTSAINAASSALTATTSASATSNLLTNAGAMLGINFGSFTVVDGDLIVSHLSTSVPSIVNGELILTYEAL
jgi:hypothetical protein